MEKKKVLIVGGYGTVGSVVAGILAGDDRIMPVVAGRNAARAKERADTLRAEWRVVDVGDAPSIASALADISVVVNCFGGPFTHAPLLLPELSAAAGIHYLDVAGSYEYAERFLQLKALAEEHDATLITALGANPGIPGIALMRAKEAFERLESARIVFVMGARIDGISASSLKELKHMFDVAPLVWRKPRWQRPEKWSGKEYVGKPFDKEVYVGVSLTRDLLALPAAITVDELSFWSGSQSAIQGLAMIAGLKAGLTRSDRGARLLLKLLRFLGRGKGSVSDVFIRVECIGLQRGHRRKQSLGLHCDENYATALAPAIVCRQLLDGMITRRGAFVPPEVVAAPDFMYRLEQCAVQCGVTTEAC